MKALSPQTLIDRLGKSHTRSQPHLPEAHHQISTFFAFTTICFQNIPHPLQPLQLSFTHSLLLFATTLLIQTQKRSSMSTSMLQQIELFWV
ncbi:unnamed protein product [Citrullus colocynthis]|uniref:Uncharacterized protein n=1 Tax=Citrullus colocynthis TaxID=252529 RepID=A0ABP0YXV7_9ROSI